jgi:hypothetical protein
MDMAGKLSTIMFISVLHAAYGDNLKTQQLETLLCVQEIASSSFMQGRPLVTSMPSDLPDFSGRTMNRRFSAGSDFKLADRLLQNMHKSTKWPLLTSRPDIQIPETNMAYKHESYIMLLWADETEEGLLNTLRKQLDHMTDYGDSWNLRGHFLVVVTHFGLQSPKALAKNITEILWGFRISDSLIMVPNALDFNSTTNETKYSYDLYTWFPYESGQCETPEKVVLLERCVLGKDRCLSKNISLFPSKIPLNMHGCPVRVHTFESHPNVISAPEHKKENCSNNTYQYRGVEIEYLLLLGEAMNMTIEFLPPPAGKFYLSDFFIHSLTSVVDGEAHITMGNFPLHDRAASYCQPTVPYIYTSFKWYVPCARPIRRLDSIMNVFTAPVWLALVLTLVVSALLFWGIANRSCSSVTQEPTTYKTVSLCLSVAWAVLVGVSVAEMPRTFRLRSFFFVFVCYCLAMNTVYQVFFTSFLIEPIYEKQIATFDEIVKSDIEFLEHPALKTLSLLINYDEHRKLGSRRQNCDPFKDCMSRLLKGQDVTTMVMDLYAEYFASTAGRRENGKKSLCSTDTVVFTMGLTMYLSKGDILIDRFNVLIQRCLEAGLGNKYWSELNWNATMRKHDEGLNDDVPSANVTYFAFTVSHLAVAFYILIFGNAVSFIVFLAELLSKFCFPRVKFFSA